MSPTHKMIIVNAPSMPSLKGTTYMYLYRTHVKVCLSTMNLKSIPLMKADHFDWEGVGSSLGDG